MLVLKKIGITGNIASGKTTALKIFKKNKCYCINSDDLTHLLLNKKDIKKIITEIFGKEILEKNKIDRKKLAKIVFNNKKKLKTLENILHPEILDQIEQEYKKVSKKNYHFFVVEVPLLFEIGIEKYFDYIITIHSKINIAKKRYKDKDYMLRKKNLLSISKKIKLSNYFIENNHSLSSFEKKIEKVLNKIKQEI